MNGQLTGLWRKNITDSPFLASDDFEPGGPPISLTITGVTMERPTNPQTKKEEEKPALHFSETPKLFVLNIKKCRAIASLAGSNKMEKWVGHRIGLQYGRTKVAGKPVGCIDVVQPAAAGKKDDR